MAIRIVRRQLNCMCSIGGLDGRVGGSEPRDRVGSLKGSRSVKSSHIELVRKRLLAPDTASTRAPYRSIQRPAGGVSDRRFACRLGRGRTRLNFRPRSVIDIGARRLCLDAAHRWALFATRCSGRWRSRTLAGTLNRATPDRARSSLRRVRPSRRRRCRSRSVDRSRRRACLNCDGAVSVVQTARLRR